MGEFARSFVRPSVRQVYHSIKTDRWLWEKYNNLTYLFVGNGDYLHQFRFLIFYAYQISFSSCYTDTFFSLRIYHIINLLERNCCNNARLYASLYIYLYFLMLHVHQNTLTSTILFVSFRIYSFSGLFIIQHISLKKTP